MDLKKSLRFPLRKKKVGNMKGDGDRGQNRKSSISQVRAPKGETERENEGGQEILQKNGREVCRTDATH